jgi:hypothetical protein
MTLAHGKQLQRRQDVRLPAGVPADAADFLLACLMPNPAKRSHAHDLLNGSFLKTAAAAVAAAAARNAAQADAHHRSAALASTVGMGILGGFQRPDSDSKGQRTQPEPPNQLRHRNRRTRLSAESGSDSSLHGNDSDAAGDRHRPGCGGSLDAERQSAQAVENLPARIAAHDPRVSHTSHTTGSISADSESSPQPSLADRASPERIAMRPSLDRDRDASFYGAGCFALLPPSARTSL